jgi:hypothetical protein
VKFFEKIFFIIRHQTPLGVILCGKSEFHIPRPENLSPNQEKVWHVILVKNVALKRAVGIRDHFEFLAIISSMARIYG